MSACCGVISLDFAAYSLVTCVIQALHPHGRLQAESSVERSHTLAYTAEQVAPGGEWRTRARPRTLVLFEETVRSLVLLKRRS